MDGTQAGRKCLIRRVNAFGERHCALTPQGRKKLDEEILSVSGVEPQSRPDFLRGNLGQSIRPNHNLTEPFKGLSSVKGHQFLRQPKSNFTLLGLAGLPTREDLLLSGNASRIRDDIVKTGGPTISIA